MALVWRGITVNLKQ